VSWYTLDHRGRVLAIVGGIVLAVATFLAIAVVLADRDDEPPRVVSVGGTYQPGVPRTPESVPAAAVHALPRRP
jgi:hypothetical protein